MASSHSESLFEAVLIAEAELASEAARPNPRRNQTSGLKFVLKTAPWRPGGLSSDLARGKPGACPQAFSATPTTKVVHFQRHLRGNEPFEATVLQKCVAQPIPFSRSSLSASPAWQTLVRNATHNASASHKWRALFRNATHNAYRSAEIDYRQTQSGDRLPEIRSKTRTVAPKRVLGGTGSQPASDPAAPWSLQRNSANREV